MDVSRAAESHASLGERISQRGITKGDRVAVLARPSLDYLATFMGATAIGAIWVGLNPRYTPEELARVVRDAAPRVLALDLEHSSIVDRLALDRLSAGLPKVQVISVGTGSPQGGLVPKPFLHGSPSRRSV